MKISQPGIRIQNHAECFVAWGKLNDSGKSHPLIAHMLDVAACFQAVSELPSVRRAMVCLAGRSLTAQDVSRLSALAFLHDIGKANAGFQAKRWAHDGLATPRGWPETAGHATEDPVHFSAMRPY